MESNPKGFELLKTYLAVSLWTQYFGKNKSITLETLRWFAQWLEAQSLQGPAQFLDVRGENEKIPKNDFP